MTEPTATLEIRYPNDLEGWTAGEPYIRRALQTTDRWDWRDVLAAYVQGEVGLGLLRNDAGVFGALIYEIIRYPKVVHFHIHLFSADGNSDDVWQSEVLPQVKAFARGQGCQALTGEGRHGWAKKLGGKINYSFELSLWEGEE